MKYKLQDLIDMDHFQNLLDRLNEVYSFPSSIIDNEGNILTATAWQDICTQFHRKNKECEKHCIQSDQYIKNHIHEANPAVTYCCPHGLVDNATPIIIDGFHYGNFFTGQFFLEKPDMEFFRAQAQKYGFDEDAYLKAVKRVPIWTQKQLNNYLFFIKGLITVISESGLKSLKEIENRKLIETSEKSHKSILKTAMDGYWLTDTKGRLLEVNDSYCRMSGYSEDDLLMMHISDLEDTENFQLVTQHIQKVISQGSDRFESKHHRKDGTVFDVEVSLQFLPEKDGQIVCFLRDITERKLAEVALKNSERKWRNILINTPQIGIALNRNAEIVFTNEYFMKLTGWEEQEMLGRDWFDMFIPDNVREEVRGVFKTVMSRKDTHGLSSYANEIIAKDRTLRNVAWSNVLTKDSQGEIVDVTCLGIDLTERRRAEEELKRSEETYRLLVENQTDLVVKVDLEGRFLFVSPSYCRMFGKKEHELLGENFMPLVHEEDKEPTAKAMEALFSPPYTVYVEQRVMTKEGWRWLAWVDTAVLDKSGSVNEIIGVGRDLTDKKRAEEEQLMLETQLQQSQKMESIGTLAGGIAHEFNNMLAIIIGNNELIMEELPQGSLARESTEEIQIAGLRAKDVVKQLLTFSRQDDVVKKVMDFKFVVEKSMKLIRSSTATNIKIEQNLSADTYPVMGNDTQINQVLINLCNNAIDALPEKGGIITIELLNETIDMQQIQHQTKLPPGQYAKLMVRDNGIGMDTEILGRIFEPYYTTKVIGEGTGIGMAVVHGIVERHGGAIIVDSKSGRGTTFTIFFPAHKGLFEQEIEERDIPPVGDEYILYVDDEPSIATLGKRLLESLGYTAESTTDPEKALDMVRSDPNKFDLLITDMAMPNMTGDQLVIETLKIRQDMPTIICTGYSAKVSEKEAADIGVCSYLMKPVKKSELAKMVRKVLDGAKGADLVEP